MLLHETSDTCQNSFIQTSVIQPINQHSTKARGLWGITENLGTWKK